MGEQKLTVITAVVATELDSSTSGLLGAGQRLSSDLDAAHVVVACGKEDSEFATSLAIYSNQVIMAISSELVSGQSEAWLHCLAKVGAELKPTAILLANDTLNQEMTPRLAHRLGGASMGDAQALTAIDGRVSVKRPVYGGKAVANIELQKNPAVVWVRAQSMEPAQPLSSRGTITTMDLGDQPEPKIQLLESKAEATEGERLEDAQLIVSGGRGLGGPEAFEALKDLAHVLNAQTAASRAACDLGWVPHSWQVGQTGKKVAPLLYLAVAISGASQHMMGIADAKVIAAINTDPDAPIFKHCQFGLVEDYQNVIEPLKERLAELLK